MRRRTALLVLLGIWLLAIPLWAQPLERMGTVRGTVKFNDGTPFAGATVALTMGEYEDAGTCDEQGSFMITAPAGRGILRVRDVEQPVNVVGGQVAAAALVVKLRGIVVELVTPQGAALREGYDEVQGMYRHGGDAGSYGMTGEPVAPGRVWFTDAPADVTALGVVLRLAPGGTIVRQRWTFDQPAEVRKLTMTVAGVTQTKIRVTDAAGTPLRERALRGILTYQRPVIDETVFWDDRPAATAPARSGINGVATDREGMLAGSFAAGQYALSLIAGDQAGPCVAFEVRADGVAVPAEYRMTLASRDVAQTVLGADGRPVPQAEVFATYTWREQSVLLRQTADANGQVVWTALPPVRVIVWGKGIPAGVIAPEVTRVTAPLPAPVVEEEMMPVTFTVTNADPAAMQFAYVARGVELYTMSTEGMGGPAADDGQVPDGAAAGPIDLHPAVSGVGRPGAPFSVMLWTKTPLPLVATIMDGYLPYSDGADQADLPLTLQAGAQLRGRFVDKNGQAIAGVSKLGLLPVNLGEIEALLDDPVVRGAGLMVPVEGPDGTFEVSLPVPGTYRLLVDLFDASTPAPPELLVEARPGDPDRQITLPEPLALVPPGAEIRWVTWTAPADTRTLIAAALAPAMPVYGPRAQMLALWYRPSPDKLVLWNAADPAQPQQTLALRTVFVKPALPAGMGISPGDVSFALLPLLPQSFDELAAAPPSVPHASAESKPTLVTSLGATRLNLWPGRYIISGDTLQRMPLGVLTVPAEGDRQLTAPLEMPNGDAAARERYVQLRFPRADYAALRETTSDGLCIIAGDVRLPQEIGRWSLEQGEDAYMPVPASAKSITLQWLGHGVCRDLPVPAAGEPGQPTLLTLPGWQPGTPLAGTVLRADGQPYANAALRVGTDLSGTTGSVLIQTDAQGRFTVKGLLPGAVFVALDSGDYWGGPFSGWTLTLPEAGLQGVVLRESTEPVQLTLAMRHTGWESAQLWWIPDRGAAVRVPSRMTEAGCHNLPLGPGWLWAIDGLQGRARYVRLTSAPGAQLVPDPAVPGPSLGILLPLTGQHGQPGAVTLIGQGERQGITATFATPYWQPSSALNMVVGQIQAVPPGSYRILVTTSQGQLEGQVTITAEGGTVKLGFPAAG